MDFFGVTTTRALVGQLSEGIELLPPSSRLGTFMAKMPWINILSVVHKELQCAYTARTKRDIAMRTKPACSTLNFDPDKVLRSCENKT